MAISDWPKTERPREKLLLQGAQSLSDAELLAIFLRTGVKGKSALDLSRELLKNLAAFGPCWQPAGTSSAHLLDSGMPSTPSCRPSWK